jgi:hypothetical protein
MREAGVLNPTRVMALERRMGLGESVFIVEAKEKGYDLLPDVFYAIDTVYHYSSTYGRYNGFLAYSLYSLSTPRIVRRIMEECQKYDLISDFFIVDVTDYDAKGADYSKFDPDCGWTWDASQWEEQIDKNVKSRKKFKNPMSAAQTIVEYDHKDVSILRLMFDNGEITQKELAKTLQLSEAQVNKRIHRLEKKGIIKGYSSALAGSSDLLAMFCFLELKDPNGPVLPSIYDLPFPATIIMESETRYVMTTSFSSKSMSGFLGGLDLLRPYLNSSFIQTVHRSKPSMDSHPYDLYNKETHGWVTPGDEYLKDVRDVMAGKRSKKDWSKGKKT